MGGWTGVCRWPAVLIVATLLAGTPPAAAEEHGYVFGVPPWQRGLSVDDIRRLYRPLLDYLAVKIDAPIRLVSARTYDEMIEYFVDGRVDFGTISPVPFVTVQSRNPGVRMLVTELSWNEDRTQKVDAYRGLWVTLKSRRDIGRIEDLRGKAFGFVTEKSSSGYAYPAAIMRARGLDPESFFGTTYFLGSHPRVTDAVAAGSIDAGATWDFNLAQAIAKHGDVFKIFHQVLIPNLGIAALPSMPPPVQETVKQALLAVDARLLDGLPTVGYVERPDEFYDGVREIAGLRRPQ